MISPVDSSGTGEQGAIEPQSFIASDSVLYEETPPNNAYSPSWTDWKSTEEQLQRRYLRAPFTNSGVPLRQALLDSFAGNFGHWFSFINTSQIHEKPPLLQNAFLMAGSLARRIETVDDLQLPYALYQQSKEAIYASDGKDPITLLMAITIMSCWSLRPPSIISLDGPWHWTGLAMRLALQIGLHSERIYSHLQDSDNCRLVWWHLVNGDVLQAACWGRPCLIQTRHQDVELPAKSDLDTIPLQAFNQITRLLLILRQVIELDMLQLSDVVAALVDWHRTVAFPLKLHNVAGARNSYNRPINEMFVFYFGIIIFVFFRHDMTEGHRTYVSPITIAASSCMVRLLEEIHYHEDTPRLCSIHGFFFMLAAIPQIFHRTQVAEKEHQRERELDLICDILRHLRVKYGGSNMVLQKISKLRDGSHNLSESQPMAAHQGGLPKPVTGVVSGGNLLFPFPVDFSPNLDLLDSCVSGNEDQMDMMDFLAFESSLIDWSAPGSLELSDFPQSLFV
ncbi:hypothetical protein BDV25DRAFT_169611 [Aspergillus avenaceus]|uniref:Xylanolytic transcriptional activator regulatory domain-containing protein n=1 Tax=Aspergillus avenaceus TaxID=36643 RepID=A0A5N6TKZ6_ASPAV|nr:hypothetical protein BDV25DRAFT_169611 [Aspergillus avenaceus]